MNNLFKKHEWQFIAWFSGIFLLTMVVLSIVGFVPTEFKDATQQPGFFERIKLAVLGVEYWQSPQIEGNSSQVHSSASQVDRQGILAEYPVRMVISSIGLDTVIRNPSSTNAEVLDIELTRGVVRYPGSGFPGSGNMFVFGHSTGFSVVQNQAFKVFNRLKDLQPGDEINVYSGSREYVYKVSSVRKVDKNDTWVKFDGGRDILTLSTCDSFGKKSDRYVVEADYTGMRGVK